MLPALFIKQTHDLLVLEKFLKPWIEGRVVRRAKPDLSLPHQVIQSWILRNQGRLAWSPKLSNDLATVRYKDVLTTFDEPDVLAEPVLQLSDSYCLHTANVASCSYISKEPRLIV